MSLAGYIILSIIGGGLLWYFIFYLRYEHKDTVNQLRSNLKEANKEIPGYYGDYAICRNIDPEEALQRIKNGENYTIRIKSEGIFERKFKFNDLANGEMELHENDIDTIIYKSSTCLPTYHFAHLVDDYLMGTTHVLRDQNWLPSTPLHIDLFKALGVNPPNYAHKNIP